MERIEHRWRRPSIAVAASTTRSSRCLPPGRLAASEERVPSPPAQKRGARCDEREYDAVNTGRLVVAAEKVGHRDEGSLVPDNGRVAHDPRVRDHSGTELGSHAALAGIARLRSGEWSGHHEVLRSRQAASPWRRTAGLAPVVLRHGSRTAPGCTGVQPTSGKRVAGVSGRRVERAERKSAKRRSGITTTKRSRRRRQSRRRRVRVRRRRAARHSRARRELLRRGRASARDRRVDRRRPARPRCSARMLGPIVCWRSLGSRRGGPLGATTAHGSTVR